jgi:outer membrane lipoprotein SlyB
MPSDEKVNSATLQLSKLEVGGHMREVNSGSARADADEKLNTGEKTAIGAAAGAVVGAVTGAGVIKGAVVGAGGGLAWGLLTHGDNRVKDDTHLRFQLQKDVS